MAKTAAATASKSAPAAKGAAATSPTAVPAAGADGAADAAPKKKKSKLLLMAVLLVVLAGGGGAAWYFLGTTPTAEAKAAAPKPPMFMNLEPFTVNLAEESGDHYLQVGIVYQVTDDKAVEQLKLYMPVLRNRLLLLLSSKTPGELAPPEGKKKLVEELVAAARESIPGSTPDKGVSNALLASFVIQ